MIYNKILLEKSCSPGMYLLSSFSDISLAFIFAILASLFGITINFFLFSDECISSSTRSIIKKITKTILLFFLLVMFIIITNSGTPIYACETILIEMLDYDSCVKEDFMSLNNDNSTSEKSYNNPGKSALHQYHKLEIHQSLSGVEYLYSPKGVITNPLFNENKILLKPGYVHNPLTAPMSYDVKLETLWEHLETIDPAYYNGKLMELALSSDDAYFGDNLIEKAIMETSIKCNKGFVSYQYFYKHFIELGELKRILFNGGLSPEAADNIHKDIAVKNQILTELMHALKKSNLDTDCLYHYKLMSEWNYFTDKLTKDMSANMFKARKKITF